MNCIIIDDKTNCKLLEDFVAKFTSLIHVATFTDSKSAINQLSKCQDIGLVFLEVEIFNMDVFDFINSLSCKPNIILISSNDHFALKAFEANVVDYLLKPITYSRFCKAVDKAIRYYSRKDFTNSLENEIFIKSESSLIKLKLKNVIYIEALDNYVTLITDEEKYSIHFTMNAIENILPSGVFVRIHQSYIVNKSVIKAIHERSLDIIFRATLKSLPIGDSFRNLLLKEINILEKRNISDRN